MKSKVESVDSELDRQTVSYVTNHIVGQTCANKRAELLGKTGPLLIGQFVPECELDGNYKEVQCWGSVGQCWCVDRLTGVQVDGTMTRGTPKCQS